MNEWILIILLHNTPHSGGPVLLSGYESKKLCEVAGKTISKTITEMGGDSSETKYSCVETKKTETISARKTNAIKPSKPKNW